MNSEFQNLGFAIAPQVIDLATRGILLHELGEVARAGRRRILALPAIAEFAASRGVIDLVSDYLGSRPTPIRAIYFDKSPDNNWFVSWHQDLTIAVRERADVAGFGPWSTKDGIPHVQPPVEVLEKMLAMRIHFDDTDDSNGGLRLLPGSHHFGRLSSEQIRMNSFVP
jgi:hypothetical protein